MKIVIPAILGITILIGAVIATMPVQQASTVHSTLSANILNADRFLAVTIEGNTTDTVNVHNYVNLTEYAAGAYDEAFISIHSQNAAAVQGEGCYILAEQGGTTFNSDEAGEAILISDNDVRNQNNTGNEVSPYPAADLVDQLRVLINSTSTASSRNTGDWPDCTVIIQFEDTDI